MEGMRPANIPGPQRSVMVMQMGDRGTGARPRKGPRLSLRLVPLTRRLRLGQPGDRSAAKLQVRPTKIPVCQRYAV